MQHQIRSIFLFFFNRVLAESLLSSNSSNSTPQENQPLIDLNTNNLPVQETVDDDLRSIIELSKKEEEERAKRIQDEEQAAQEQEAKRQAAEYAAALAARMESLKPEIEKAENLAQSMITDAQDSLARLGNPAWSSDAMHAIRNCGATIISLVQSR